MSYIGNEPIVSASRTVTEATATAGQTTFLANGGYVTGFLDVFVNGAQLQNSDFTANNGTSVVLASPCAAGDDVRLVAWGTFNVSSTYSRTEEDTLLAAKLNAANPSYSGTLTGGTGVVNIGSGQLYKDASGNVGIGTASPAQKLDVVSTGSTIARFTRDLATDSVFSIGGDNDGTVLESTGINVMRFFTSSTERMRIDSNGTITKPNQPWFFGRPSCSTSAGVSNQMYSTQSQGGMTWSSDRIYAPVAGVYMITWQAISSNSSVRTDTNLRYNGTVLNSGLSEDSTTGFHQRTHSIAWKMSAGDYIQLYHNNWYNVNNNPGEWGSFSFYLLG